MGAMKGLNQELAGRVVISVEQAVAAPYCGLLLADAGARVIKVERPEGDFARGYDEGANGNSVFFAWLNRGKESICIDFENPRDLALLKTMLLGADVFLHNLAPGALAKRGLSGNELRQQNPRLINCQISGYGLQGAAANKKAYDFLVQAEGGLCAVTGTPQHPARVGVSLCDLATGLTAFSGILRALLQRAGGDGHDKEHDKNHEKGMDISVSMFDVIGDWMNMPLLAHRYLGQAPPRLGLTHALIAPYGAYQTRDGNHVLIAIQNNREWKVFCAQVLRKPALGEDQRFADNPKRVKNRDAMDAIINAVFQNKNRDELLALLDNARIACAQLSSVAELSEHACLRNHEVNFGEATVSLADLPIRIDGRRPTEVPLLDQHGPAIRQEFQA